MTLQKKISAAIFSAFVLALPLQTTGCFTAARAMGNQPVQPVVVQPTDPIQPDSSELEEALRENEALKESLRRSEEALEAQKAATAAQQVAQADSSEKAGKADNVAAVGTEAEAKAKAMEGLDPEAEFAKSFSDTLEKGMSRIRTKGKEEYRGRLLYGGLIGTEGDDVIPPGGGEDSETLNLEKKQKVNEYFREEGLTEEWEENNEPLTKEQELLFSLLEKDGLLGGAKKDSPDEEGTVSRIRTFGDETYLGDLFYGGKVIGDGKAGDR